eukprot:8796470-Pyramimonas_sp.AAC.2
MAGAHPHTTHNAHNPADTVHWSATGVVWGADILLNMLHLVRVAHQACAAHLAGFAPRAGVRIDSRLLSTPTPAYGVIRVLPLQRQGVKE